MNILGIDYGEKHIGIAIATSPLAEPLTTVDTSSAPDSIRDLVSKHVINELVIGDCPDAFLSQLKSLNLPIHVADETLSSYDARNALLHTTQTRRKQNEHAVAAAILLQNWLDSPSEKR